MKRKKYKVFHYKSDVSFRRHPSKEMEALRRAASSAHLHLFRIDWRQKGVLEYLPLDFCIDRWYPRIRNSFVWEISLRLRVVEDRLAVFSRDDQKANDDQSLFLPSTWFSWPAFNSLRPLSTSFSSPWILASLPIISTRSIVFQELLTTAGVSSSPFPYLHSPFLTSIEDRLIALSLLWSLELVSVFLFKSTMQDNCASKLPCALPFHHHSRSDWIENHGYQTFSRLTSFVSCRCFGPRTEQFLRSVHSIDCPMFSHSCSNLSRRTISRRCRFRPRLRRYHRNRWIRHRWSFAFVRRRTKCPIDGIDPRGSKYWLDWVDGVVSLAPPLVPIVQQWKPSSVVCTRERWTETHSPFKEYTRCLARLSLKRFSSSRISATCSTLVRSLRCMPCCTSDDCTEYS